MQTINVLPMVEDEEQAKAKHSHDVSCQRQQEEEEVSIVPPADAVVHPWTVVVEVLRYWNEETLWSENLLGKWHVSTLIKISTLLTSVSFLTFRFTLHKNKL